MIAHSNVTDHLALSEFISNMDNPISHLKPSNLSFKGRSEDFNSQFSQPSLESFVLFSTELASSLPHQMYKAKALDVSKESGLFKVVLSDGTCLISKSVVVSIGQGQPYVPEIFAPWMKEKMAVAHSSKLSSISFYQMEVCVIGGGSSAALCAIKACSDGCKKAILIHRRKIECRQFELQNEWISPKKGLLQHEFFLQDTPEKRLAFIRRERRASMTPHEMSELKRLEGQGMLQMKVGEAKSINQIGENWFEIHLEDSSIVCQKIIFDTGFRNRCEDDLLLSKIASRFPIKMTDGLPHLHTSLRWKKGLDLFVVGSYAALELGPEAFNMLGAARAARIVGSSLISVPKSFTGNSFSVLSKQKKEKTKKMKQ